MSVGDAGLRDRTVRIMPFPEFEMDGTLPRVVCGIPVRKLGQQGSRVLMETVEVDSMDTQPGDL